jgi:hypothetical protein
VPANFEQHRRCRQGSRMLPRAYCEEGAPMCKPARECDLLGAIAGVQLPASVHQRERIWARAFCYEVMRFPRSDHPRP